MSTGNYQGGLWAKVLLPDGSNDCWIWTGAKSGGYGHVVVAGRRCLAHRVVYAKYCGPIPAGLVIDHLCRNQACVNPWHLEAVTQAENVRRGISGEWQRAKTHCPQGHEYTPENTYSRPSRPERCCRTCKRKQGLESYHRRRGRA